MVCSPEKRRIPFEPPWCRGDSDERHLELCSIFLPLLFGSFVECAVMNVRSGETERAWQLDLLVIDREFRKSCRAKELQVGQ